MKRSVLIFFISFFSFSIRESSHPVYIAVTQLEYNEKKHETELSIKIFHEDMEKALQGLRPTIKSFGLKTDRELPETNNLIEIYFQKSLQIKINNKNCAFKFIGKEYEAGEVLWCYFTVDNKKSFKTIEITNTIFTELYPKQNNIIQIVQAKTRKNLLLNKDNSKGIISF